MIINTCYDVIWLILTSWFIGNCLVDLYFNFNPYCAMHRLNFIFKRSDFEKIFKYCKIRKFLEISDFTKGMHSYVSTVGLKLVKDGTLSACAQLTLAALSHTELVFLSLVCSYFSVFLLFCFFLYFEFCETHEKTHVEFKWGWNVGFLATRASARINLFWALKLVLFPCRPSQCLKGKVMGTTCFVLTSSMLAFCTLFHKPYLL